MAGIPNRSFHGLTYGSPIPPAITTIITIIKPGICRKILFSSSLSSPGLFSFPFSFSFFFLSFSFFFFFSTSLSFLFLVCRSKKGANETI
ncbi:hypothetical protein HanIR_Chr16g0805751 [Helianthus annuus]|nr:hypothetical protein HanIR_Chr16g0805751 [Helianthus annuus]